MVAGGPRRVATQRSRFCAVPCSRCVHQATSEKALRKALSARYSCGRVLWGAPQAEDSALRAAGGPAGGSKPLLPIRIRGAARLQPCRAMPNGLTPALWALESGDLPSPLLPLGIRVFGHGGDRQLTAEPVPVAVL